MSRINDRVLKVLLAAFGRAIRTVYKLDNDMRAFISELPENYTVHVKALGSSAQLALSVSSKGVKIYNKKNAPIVSDIDIVYKSAYFLSTVMKGKKSIKQSFAEHDFTLSGDITNGMILIDMLNLTCNYILSEKTIKKNNLALCKRMSTRGKFFTHYFFGI